MKTKNIKIRSLESGVRRQKTEVGRQKTEISLTLPCNDNSRPNLMVVCPKIQNSKLGFKTGFTGFNLFNSKLIICFLTFIFCIFTTVYAQEMQEGAIFLDLPQSAKIQSLGEAYVSGATGIDGVYLNAAGIADSETKAQVQTSYTTLFGQDTKYRTYAGIYNTPKISIGLSLTQLTIDNIPQTGTDFSQTRTINSYFGDKETSGTIQLAKKINTQTNIGIGIKKISQRLYNKSSKGTGIDFSIRHKCNPTTSLGILIKDLTTTKIKWSSGTQEERSPSYQIGVSKTLKALQVEIDLKKQKDKRTEALYSLQYAISSALQLRGGYNNLGLSLGIGITLSNITLDYGYHNQQLNGVSVLSIGVKW